MKQTVRDKDIPDRIFLRKLLQIETDEPDSKSLGDEDEELGEADGGIDDAPAGARWIAGLRSTRC